jgi:hypothetical protein
MGQSTVKVPASKAKAAKSPQMSLDELIASMKSLQDDVGQISELSSEEKRVVDVFFDSFLKLMKPLAKTISVSPEVLPANVGRVVQANVDPKGNLMLLYEDGQVDIRSLAETSERELMIAVLADAMPKFKQLTGAQRRKIEDRMKFLSSVTQEMQKISKAFAESIE